MDRLGHVFFPLDRRHIDMTVVAGLIFGEVRIPLPIGTQAFDIDLLNDHGALPLETLAGGEDVAVLGNVRTARKDHVCRGLTYAGRGIDISAVYTCALLLDHLAAEDMLTDDTVGGREVKDDLCTLNRQLCRRRQRRPEVLAYLDTEGVVTRAEEQVRTKGHFATPYLNLRDTRRDATGCVLACGTAGSKPTLLVELAGVGQVDLRHHTQHLTVGHNEGTVKEVIIHLERSAYEDDDRFAASIITEGLELTHTALLESLGEEEVGTGIAGKA